MKAIESSSNVFNERLLDFCEAGEVKYVELLIKLGADIHYNDDYALRLACLYNQVEVAKLLLDNGANVHADNSFPLTHSYNRNHCEMINLLEKYTNIG